MAEAPDILTPGVALTSNLAVIFTLNQHSSMKPNWANQTIWTGDNLADPQGDELGADIVIFADKKELIESLVNADDVVLDLIQA